MRFEMFMTTVVGLDVFMLFAFAPSLHCWLSKAAMIITCVIMRLAKVLLALVLRPRCRLRVPRVNVVVVVVGLTWVFLRLSALRSLAEMRLALCWMFNIVQVRVAELILRVTCVNGLALRRVLHIVKIRVEVLRYNSSKCHLS